MAFVVPVSGTDLTPESLIEWARAHMANYKVPRYVRIVRELPVNAMGKVMKYVLREQASDAGQSG
jgi:acyl-coenzyme A synthetase/AMP-(fatty) acid ligase